MSVLNTSLQQKLMLLEAMSWTRSKCSNLQARGTFCTEFL